MDPTDRLAALLIGLFNIALAPQRKKMSAALTERLRTTLYDAISPGDPIYDLLEDLLDELPPRTAREYATQVLPEVERWREQRGR
jgi:hypothetical protein